MHFCAKVSLGYKMHTVNRGERGRRPFSLFLKTRVPIFTPMHDWYCQAYDRLS